jgi:hypothetical protein
VTVVNHNPRTCKALQELGYTTEVVEHWNSFARVRNDLFGFIDVLAVGNGETLGVQVTSRSNMSSRALKIRLSPVLPVLLEAGWGVEVWGWYKEGSRWKLKVRPVHANPATPLS